MLDLALLQKEPDAPEVPLGGSQMQGCAPIVVAEVHVDALLVGTENRDECSNIHVIPMNATATRGEGGVGQDGQDLCFSDVLAVGLRGDVMNVGMAVALNVIVGSSFDYGTVFFSGLITALTCFRSKSITQVLFVDDLGHFKILFADLLALVKATTNLDRFRILNVMLWSINNIKCQKSQPRRIS